jgi:hypothetical protein
MSTMEPDEGTGADAPRWEKTEAANPPRGTDAPRWERADADAVDDDTDDSDDGTDSTNGTDS